MKKLIISFILFIAMFGMYLYHMCPTVSEGDSGEFITASVNLSIPHAPGYPLYTMVGKVFQVLVPWGNVGYRINLVSALSAALSGAVLLYMLLLLDIPLRGCLIGVLCLMFSSDFFENALVAEVFSLHAFFVVVLISLVLFSTGQSYTAQRRTVYAAAFIAGIAGGNHQSVFFLGPSFLIWFFMIHAASRRLLMTDAAVCGALFLTGLSVYAVLPLRSLKNPFLDWSNPETLQNFWRVITRADYGSFSLALDQQADFNAATVFKQIFRYGKALGEEFTVIGVLMGVAGFIRLDTEKNGKLKRQGLIVMLSFLCTGIGFLIIARMPFDAQSQGLLGRFYIMPAVLFTVGIAYCFTCFKEKYAVLGFSVIFLPLLLACTNRQSYGRRDYYIGYDYGKNILKTLPARSALFIDGGDDTFYTLAYLTKAEMKRFDLIIHDRGGLIFPNPYGSDFRKIKKEMKEERRRKVESSVIASRQPLYYSTMNWDILPGAALFLRGILFRARLNGESDVHENLWPLYSLRGVRDSPLIRHVYRVRALVPLYDYMKGIYVFETNGVDQGLQYFEQARRSGYDIEWFKTNASFELLMRGYRYYRTGDLDRAERCYRKAIVFNPRAHLAYTHLGVILEKKGDPAGSEEHYKKALAIEPKNIEAHFNLAVVYWKRAEWDKVIDELRMVLDLDPGHAQAQQYLSQALHRKK